MAITTDSYYDIIKNGVTLDRIGLSKTLDNYSISEIADYAYVGSYSQCGKQIMPKSNSGWTYVGYSQDHGSCPFSAAFHSGTFEKIDIEDGLTEDYNLTENGIYRKVVLLHDTTGTYPFNLTTSSLANMKIITEFDAPKYTMDFGTKSDMLTTESGSHYWRPYEQSSKYNTHLGYPNNEQISTCGFQAYIIIKYNNTYYFIMANVINKIFTNGLFKAENINNSNISVCANQIVDYQNSNPAGIAETVTQWFSNYDFTGDNPTPIVQNLFADAEYWNDYGGYCSVILFHDKGFRQLFNFTKEYNLLLYIAGCYGIHFIVDGTVYKPIISDNFVTGYSDDLNVASDLDGYTGSTKHDLPVTPPTPTPPTPPTPEGDDIDSNSFGGGSKLGGVDNIWLLTAQQLSDLHAAFNNNIDPNFEPLNSIISVLGLAISPLYIFGDDITTQTNITIKKSDGTSWSSGVNGHICSSQVSSFGLTGNISIKRKYNNFLDYPPYASHEMFIPLCGWVPLPSCCIGRTLSVYYVPDIQTGGVRGLVLCDGCIVAEKYGILGANIPFTSNGHGLMLGGIISGGVQTLADFATAMGGLATGNAMATVYGGSSFFSDGFNMALAANQNRTSVIGQNQDRTGFSDGTYIRIKSVYQDVKIDPLFGHTIGYLCHESGELNEFHGFTVCENPHVHISATSAEKEEIKRLLEEGVILP